MAYIYKIINDINQKIYIGKTEFSIEKRFDEHIHDAFRRKNEKRPLYAAMQKYGIEHFHIELIEETDNPEEREKYWIETLGSFKYGYNATMGGDGTKYLDYELIIKTYNEVKNQSEVARLLNISVDSVHKVLVKHNIEIINGDIVSVKALGKPVAQLDKDTLEVIKIYPSARAAEKELGIQRHIVAVCNGKRKTAGGFGWKYI